MVKMLSGKKWIVYIMGHASPGEISRDGKKDAFSLSAARTEAVARSLLKRGIPPEKITTVFYGDSKSGTAKPTRKTSGRWSS